MYWSLSVIMILNDTEPPSWCVPEVRPYSSPLIAPTLQGNLCTSASKLIGRNWCTHFYLASRTCFNKRSRLLKLFIDLGQQNEFVTPKISLLYVVNVTAVCPLTNVFSNCFSIPRNCIKLADPVAAWSEVRNSSARTQDRGFESGSGHGCLSLVSLCCVVLCRQRTCEELITCPRGPNVCHKSDSNSQPVWSAWDGFWPKPLKGVVL
jgi:hypothetical protein